LREPKPEAIKKIRGKRDCFPAGRGISLLAMTDTKNSDAYFGNDETGENNDKHEEDTSSGSVSHKMGELLLHPRICSNFD
jgi:hypothetical protein